ncbi:hypothetical protein [Pseudoteredinibacter isoporae]|uniref:Uncharacterized protein n=1 Tax=Pseudoteredinibacter isoporae TaxID=570281 RepID=A0A7X0JPX4_9GAMM|nr:hypothetical protein [Pseudoteredinibacter isoporae]MBB6520137.1 hypothetical protein [Pseudoteredinibacter isoporae]NHO85709.1 hypothetical protein [Pseudoteredinibacter isoporae]NIB25839.1 hypothetical protein [Pseudoteredinibacter isoporae]
MNDELVPLSELRQAIDIALSESMNDVSLHRFLASRAKTMHRSIGFADGDQVELLQQFVHRYIQQVPEVLDHFHKISVAAGVEDELEAFLNIAIDYFLQPLEITASHRGLLKIMDAAYLTHRLIEEVNDRFLSNAGVSISPIDNTEDNVVMHFLIGETLANELDLAVHYSVEMLISQDALFSKHSLMLYVDAQKYNQNNAQENETSKTENSVHLALQR